MNQASIRIPYVILVVVKPLCLLIGAALMSQAWLVGGYLAMLAAVAVALPLERRHAGQWVETHLDYTIRAVGVSTSIAFITPVIAALAQGGLPLVLVLGGAAETAILVGLVSAWRRLEAGVAVPERLFFAFGVESARHWRERREHEEAQRRRRRAAKSEETAHGAGRLHQQPGRPHALGA